MLRNALFRIIDILAGRSLPETTAQEQALIAQLRTTFSELPCGEVFNGSPSEMEWVANMKRLRYLVANRSPREFLRWDVIRKTMFVNQARYVRTELEYLKSRPDWRGRWRPAIEETTVGHPVPYLQNLASSGNLIHHAYHLAQFEESTGARVEDIDHVVEFGGGYGSMCRLFHRLGFQGKYGIYDLPEFSALQKYYLTMLELPVRAIGEWQALDAGIWCVTEVADLKAFAATEQKTNTMFVGTWSISEAPVPVRKLVLPLLSRFNFYLIAYQDQFGEVNNVDFFEHWKKSQGQVNWSNWRIPHLPGNSYLMGSRGEVSSGDDVHGKS
jgi:hypothetical protein